MLSKYSRNILEIFLKFSNDPRIILETFANYIPQPPLVVAPPTSQLQRHVGIFVMRWCCGTLTDINADAMAFFFCTFFFCTYTWHCRSTENNRNVRTMSTSHVWSASYAGPTRHVRSTPLAQGQRSLFMFICGLDSHGYSLICVPTRIIHVVAMIGAQLYHMNDSELCI